MRSTTRRLPISLMLCVISTAPALAQSVEGYVVDDESGAPMGTVAVVVLAPDDSVVETYVTDDNGRFVVQMPDAGSYRLRAERIGYEASVSDVFALEPGQAALAELRLQLDPVMLDPLNTIVEGQSIALARVGFYQRANMGFSEIREADYYEAKPPLDISDLFQGMTGVQVTRPRGSYQYEVFSTRRRGCRPSIHIDGATVQDGVIDIGGQSLNPNDEPARTPLGNLPDLVGNRDLQASDWQSLINVTEVGAVEVFPGQACLPSWAGGMKSPCGAILIWTKGYVMRAAPGQ